jgi:cholesterol oxidase
MLKSAANNVYSVNMPNKQNSASKIQYDYDVIVIGSGFGGSVSALRLAEKGYSVAVMEMGRRWTPERLPSSNWRFWKYLWRPGLALRGFFSLRVFRHVMVLHGNAVGGGSVTYANTLLVPPKSVWDDGSWRELDDWNAVMPAHYATAKKMLGVTENRRLGAADNALQKMAAAQGVGESFYRTSVGVFFGNESDEGGGRPYKDPYFGGAGPERHSCIACGGCMTGCKYNAKNSLDKNYLYLAEQLGTKVYEETRVNRVEPLNGSDGSDGYHISTEDTFAMFNKKRRRFTAKKVVFAGSSLGTQALLFQLKQSGAMPHISDQLGNRVRTNAESLLAVRMPGGEDMSKGIAIGSGIYLKDNTHIEAVRYGAGHDLMGLLFTPLTHGKPGPGRILLWLATCFKLLFTRPSLFIKSLNPKGFAQQSIIFLCMQTIDGYLNMRWRRPWYFPFKKMLCSEGDRIPTYIPTANEFVERSADIMGGVGASTITEILFNVPATAHCMGGCAMGENADNGVIDRENRLFGYRNAYVCDGSMLGANLGVNPSLTITALTERAMSFIPAKEPASSGG